MIDYPKYCCETGWLNLVCSGNYETVSRQIEFDIQALHRVTTDNQLEGFATCSPRQEWRDLAIAHCLADMSVLPSIAYFQRLLRHPGFGTLIHCQRELIKPNQPRGGGFCSEELLQHWSPGTFQHVIPMEFWGDGAQNLAAEFLERHARHLTALLRLCNPTFTFVVRLKGSKSNRNTDGPEDTLEFPLAVHKVQ